MSTVAASAPGSSALASASADFDAWERGLDLDGHLGMAEWGARRIVDGLADDPVSAWFCDRLTAFLEPVGICGDEVEGATGLSPASAHRLYRQVADAQEKVRLTPRALTPQQRKATLDDVREACLPVELQYLRETPLDAENGDEYPGLDSSICARLLGMRTAWMLVLAPVVVAIHRSFHPFSKLNVLLKQLERLEDLFEASGKDHLAPDAVAGVFDAYFIDKTLFPQDSPRTRIDVTGCLFMVRSLLTAYASLRPEHRDAVLALLPSMPSRDCEFERQRGVISKAIAAEAAENRKVYSDELAGRLDPTLAGSRVRRAQVRLMEVQCLRAERRMHVRDEATGRHIEGEALDFFYRERVVTPSGRRLICFQRIYMRAYRVSALRKDGGDDDIAFAFLRVEPEGVRCHAPWFIELLETGALLKPTYLPVDRRDLRRQTRIKLDLPDLHDKPAGLAGCDGYRETWLVAHALRDHGIVLVPIRALSHAMTLGLIAFRLMAYSFCRIGEALQITYHIGDKDHWVTVFHGGVPYQAFLAIPKMWEDTDEFIVDDLTARLIAVLAGMTKARERGGLLLRSPGSHVLPEHKKGENRLYVFAFRGRPLSGSDMNYIYRIMTAGLGRMRSHDIRHAAANCADEEKVKMETIKLMLRHRSEGDTLARHYARKTKAQVRALKAGFVRDRAAEDAMGLNSATDEVRT